MCQEKTELHISSDIETVQAMSFQVQAVRKYFLIKVDSFFNNSKTKNYNFFHGLDINHTRKVGFQKPNALL